MATFYPPKMAADTPRFPNFPAFIRNDTRVVVASCVSELNEGCDWAGSPESGLWLKDGIQGVRIGLGDDRMGHECIMDDKITTFLCRDKQPNGKKAHTSETWAIRLKAVRRAAKERTPFPVVAHLNHPSFAGIKDDLPRGKKYMFGASDMSEEYAIMGIYIIIEFWVEVVDGDRTLVALLQKTSRDDMWWTDASNTKEESVDILQNAGPCAVCGHLLRQRYVNEDAFCGHIDCPKSLIKPGEMVNLSVLPAIEAEEEQGEQGEDISEELSVLATKDSVDSNNQQRKREFSPAFLNQHLDVSDVDATAIKLLPPVPRQLDVAAFKELAAKKQAGKNEQERDWDREGWKSYVCTDCYRMNRREEWHRLQCRNCGKVLEIGLPDFELDDLLDPKWLEGTDINVIIKMCKGKITPSVMDLSASGMDDRYVGLRWELEGENVVIALYPTKNVIDGPDGTIAQFKALFAAAQSGELALDRRGINTRIGGMLTAYFQFNVGEHYETKAKLDTTSFEDAPTIVNDVKTQLASVIETVTGVDPDFNEVLVVGMYPDQQMRFHSDNEDQIKGPLVCSTSFGSNAVMRFGLREEYAVGGKGRGSNFTLLDILPGCERYEEKIAVKEARDRGDIDEATYIAQLTAIVKRCKAPKDPKTLFSFPLIGNGTIMAQWGPTLNNMYKHMVENLGIARLVVTGRSLKTEEEMEAQKKAKLAQKKVADAAKRAAKAAQKRAAKDSGEPSTAKRRATRKGDDGTMPS